MSIRFPSIEIEKLIEKLAVKRRIVITTHFRPDGDAMGSSLALLNYFLEKGQEANLITPSDYPEFLHWLPGNDKVINFESNKTAAELLLSEAEVIFCLDFNSLSRTEKMETPIRISKAEKVMIDHHLFPENVFTHAFSYPAASSTAELVFQFIAAMSDQKFISKAIAECIYCGIMTDTNSFRYETMRSETHRIVAALIDAGAENHKIHENVYDSNTENRLRLLGYSLKDKLVILNDYKTAYIALSEDELKMFNFKGGDTEGLVNYALSVSGIKLAAFFSEKEGSTKISFRSKGDFSVQEMASLYFNGGGHKNASGGKVEARVEEAIQKFIEVLGMYKSQLLN